MEIKVEVKVITSHNSIQFTDAVEHMLNNNDVKEIHYSKTDQHFTALIILRGKNERRKSTRAKSKTRANTANKE